MKDYKYIDIALLEEVADGSNELINDLVDMFEVQAPKFTKQLEDLFTQKDFIALSKLAHKIKGTLSTVGITALAHEMKELEGLAKNEEDLNRCHTIISNYSDISQKALFELKDFVKRT